MLNLLSTHSKQDRLFVWYGGAAFILNSVMRSSIMHFFHFSIPDINYICVMIVLYFLLRNRSGKYIQRKRIFVFICMVLFALLTLFSNICGNNVNGVLVLMISVLPGMLLILENIEFDNIAVFVDFRKVYNIFVIPILCIGIADYFLGGVVNTFLALRCSSADWANMIFVENKTYGFRMCTILGSPLMNGFFSLFLIIINSIYSRCFCNSKTFYYAVCAVGIVSIILTGSRMAFILALIFLFVNSLSEENCVKRIIILALVLVLVVFLVNTELFKNTIGVRFSSNLTQDVRFSLIKKVFAGDYGKLRVFFSDGYNYSRRLTANNTTTYLNFELPVLMFLYDYGIVSTICYYIVFLLYPVISLWNNKYILVTYICIFLHLNSFNCLAQKYDFNIMLGFVVVLFINISQVRQLKKKENYQEKEVSV